MTMNPLFSQFTLPSCDLEAGPIERMGIRTEMGIFFRFADGKGADVLLPLAQWRTIIGCLGVIVKEPVLMGNEKVFIAPHRSYGSDARKHSILLILGTIVGHGCYDA